MKNMSTKLRKPFPLMQYVITLGVIVMLTTFLAFVNNNSNSYSVLALKKVNQNHTFDVSLISPQQTQNATFHRVIDGQRNICHNDYDLNAVVCVKDATYNDNISNASSPIFLLHSIIPALQQQVYPQQSDQDSNDSNGAAPNISNPHSLNETATNNNSSVIPLSNNSSNTGLRSSAASTTNSSSTMFNSTHINLDTSAIYSTPMTPEIVESLLNQSYNR
jgi:hypothetical protein